MSVPYRPLAEMTPTDCLDELTRLLARGLARFCLRWLRSGLADGPADTYPAPSNMDFPLKNDLRTPPK